MEYRDRSKEKEKEEPRIISHFPIQRRKRKQGRGLAREKGRQEDSLAHGTQGEKEIQGKAVISTVGKLKRKTEKNRLRD